MTTESSLWYFRQFYLADPADPGRPILHALRGELSWTHYRLLLGVEKPEARAWYMNEAADQNWSIRALTPKGKIRLPQFQKMGARNDYLSQESQQARAMIVIE